MKKQKKQLDNQRKDSLIKIYDLLPHDNVKGGSGKIVFGDLSLNSKKATFK